MQEGEEVLRGTDLAHKRVQSDDARRGGVFFGGGVENSPPSADEDAIKARGIKMRNRVQGVLLGAAEIEARDDVDDFGPSHVEILLI